MNRVYIAIGSNLGEPIKKSTTGDCGAKNTAAKLLGGGVLSLYQSANGARRSA